MSAQRHGFFSEQPGQSWEDGLIAGNGVHGALVLGHPHSERVIVNRAGLFLPFWEPVPTVPTREYLPELRALLSSRQYRRAAERVIEVDNEHERAGDRWTDPLIPACELRLSALEADVVTDYRRGVDFESGLVSVQFGSRRGRTLRRVFASRTDDALVVSLTAPDGGLDYDLALCEPLPTSPADVERRQAGIGEVDIVTSTSGIHYTSHFRRRWPGSLRGHVAVARVVTNGGNVTLSGSTLQARGANELLILLRVALVRDSATPELATLEHELARLEPSFELLFERHRRVHSALFGRIRLDLGGREHAVPSEQLLARARVAEPNASLLEKQFDAARYAILSSSGELPPTLQGIWSGTYCPPWSSDYTHNGNVPTAMAGALVTSMPECLEPLLHYHWSLLRDYRSNAERLYGCRGILVPSRTSSHGLHNHFNVTWTMTFWTAGAAWACHFFYDYYLHTGDLGFLRERALPFMQETLLFYEDFLKPGPNGQLSFNPSYSPENAPLGSEAQACVDATMDMAVTRELCNNLLEVCATLGGEAETAARCRALLAQLPDYRINADGAVAEWLPAELADNYAHRHLSHLYALFDGLPPEIEQRPELLRACRVALERRLRVRQRENGGIMAFGLAQLGLVAVSLGDAATCQEVLGWLSANFFRSSLVSTHDPGELFNVDICGGLPALVVRCLVDSWPGRLDVLRALPAAFPRGSLEGASCRGRVHVRRLGWTPERVELTLESDVAQSVTLRLGVPVEGSASQAVRLTPGEPLQLSWTRA